MRQYHEATHAMQPVKRLIIDQRYCELGFALVDLGEDQPTSTVSQPTQSVPQHNQLVSQQIDSVN